MNATASLTYALSRFFLLIVMFVVIKSRYQKFTNRDFVLGFRNGKLRSVGYGGGYFVLPLIDKLIVLSTTVNNLEISTEELMTRENKTIKVKGFVIWRIEDPVKAHQSIFVNQELDGIVRTNKILEQLFESSIRTIITELTLDQILTDNEYIIETIMTELVSVVNPMGIKVITAEISNVKAIEAIVRNEDAGIIYSKGSIKENILDSQNNKEINYKETKL